MRVTDLDKFSLQEIWWPFQTIMGYEERLNKPPLSLDDTAVLLAKPSYWSGCVLDRLSRIGVTFPSYVVHPLVDVVRAAQTRLEG